MIIIFQSFKGLIDLARNTMSHTWEGNQWQMEREKIIHAKSDQQL